jgi:hypothetical protein
VGRHERPREQYPNDYLHTARPHAQVQRDIGGSLLLGALAVVALMALLATGLFL